MQRYILRRLLASIPILLGISFLTFLIINAAPGDPLTAMVDPEAGVSQESLNARREALGLNKPLLVRYAIWLKEIARGNLGYSVTNQRPVLNRILERLPATLQLTMSAMLLGLLVGIPLGAISAVKPYSPLDHVLTVMGFVGASTPHFFLGLAGIYLLSLKLNLLPTAGMQTLGSSFNVLDRLRHLILPMTIMSMHTAASLMRYTRSSMRTVLSQDYVRTARGKGLSETTVIVRHVLRNALLPIITILGMSLPSLFGGAVITEQIFQWPGIGMLSIQSVTSRDYPMLMGLNLMSALMVFLGNLLADICYAFVDPRIVYK